MRAPERGSSGRRVTAFPAGVGSDLILGSSEAGATVPPKLSRPFAFASHYAPRKLAGRQIYTARASALGAAICAVMLGLNVVAADTDEREVPGLVAATGCSEPSPRAAPPVQPPIEGWEETLPPADGALLGEAWPDDGGGSPSTVRDEIRRFGR